MTTIRAGGVKGPASTTDGFMTVFDGTTGKTIKAHASGAPGTMAFETATNYLAKSGGTMTGALQSAAGDASAPGLAIGEADSGFFLAAADSVGFTLSGSERYRFDSSGRELRGHSSSVALSGIQSRVQYNGSTGGDSSFSGIRWSNNSSPAALQAGKSRSATPGSLTVVQSGDRLVQFLACGDNGSAFVAAGNIDVVASGDWSVAGTRSARIDLQTIIADTFATRASIGNGMWMAGATGGDQGAGTVNAVNVYDNGVLLTDLVAEFAETGTVDLKKWDATVPDLVIPEVAEDVPVMEEVQERQEVFERDADGSLVRKFALKTVSREKVEFDPIWDEAGNGIGALEIPVTKRTVVRKESRTKRPHYAAHMFKNMIDGGFDPRKPEMVFDYIRQKKCLPGMPDETEWKTKKFSLGEMQTRSTLAVEIVTLAMERAFAKLEQRLAALEGRR